MMTDAEWIAAIAATVTVTMLASAWIGSWISRARIEGYDDLLEGVRQSRVQLNSVMAKTEKITAALRARSKKLGKITERTRNLVAMEARSDQIAAAFEANKRSFLATKKAIAQRQAELEKLDTDAHQLKKSLDLYSRIEDFVDYGLYEEPEYLFETYERFKVELKRVRDRQKLLIKEKRAVERPEELQVDGSSKTGAAVLTGQEKLMLKTFNVECDLLIGKVNAGNYARTLERIEKLAEGLEKSAVSLMCGIKPDYVQLKYDECTLQYQARLKKDEEREEQRRINEQMREEARAEKEYQDAIKKAEEEERQFESLLERARAQLQEARDDERVEYELRVAHLEEQLAEAVTKEERARSLAQQTRRGHVYVISNVGSFGDDVYKIGLTRRLDPMERVKELGDASVPFTFDVHAVIFSDDAPALESALHQEFDRSRVNCVNRRKEFFRVKLNDIRSAVERICGADVDFRMTVLAEEYYESLRLQGVTQEAA